MEESLIIAIRPQLLTTRQTGSGAGWAEFDFNVAVADSTVRAHMKRLRPFVDMVLKSHGGEILDDGQTFIDSGDKPTKDSARFLIRAPRAAIDDLAIHPYVEECAVLDPEQGMKQVEAFCYNSMTGKVDLTIDEIFKRVVNGLKKKWSEPQ